MISDLVVEYGIYVMVLALCKYTYAQKYLRLKYARCHCYCLVVHV
jgi:hypothetical protein